MFLTDFFQNLKELRIFEKVFFLLVFIDTLLLIFFGKGYTTFSVIKHIHLHDIFLGIIFSLTFLFKTKTKLKSIEFLIAISLFYLLLSIPRILELENGLYVVIRQYMIFGYLAIGYAILRTISTFKNGIQLACQLILISGFIAVLVQVTYVIYLFIYKDISPFTDRYSFSPIIEAGIIIVGAYFLTHVRGFIGHLLYALVFILSLTIGQDSAYLSLIVIYMMFFILKVRLKVKLIIISFFLLSIVLLFIFIPSFTDVNMTWRLIYWNSVIKELWDTKDIFFGKAFGTPYLSEQTRESLNYLMKSKGYGVDFTLISLKEKYEVTAHNSFITLVYHLGLFSFLLILYPIKRLFVEGGQWFENKITFSLILTVIGLSVWACFNLILELPHTSSLFWIIFFTLLFILKRGEKNLANKGLKE